MKHAYEAIQSEWNKTILIKLSHVMAIFISWQILKEQKHIYRLILMSAMFLAEYFTVSGLRLRMITSKWPFEMSFWYPKRILYSEAAHGAKVWVPWGSCFLSKCGKKKMRDRGEFEECLKGMASCRSMTKTFRTEVNDVGTDYFKIAITGMSSRGPPKCRYSVRRRRSSCLT